jgi:two-component system, chemotaxis family, sensor kinase CheA
MMEGKQDFMTRLQATFRREAVTHTGAMKALLDDMRHEPEENRLQLLQTLIREVHSLKGAASAVEQNAIEYLTRSLEQVLFKLQRGDIMLSAVFFELFHASIALIEEGVKEDAEGKEFTVPLHFFEDLRKLENHP